MQADLPELAAARAASPGVTQGTREQCFSRLLTLLGWACKPPAAPRGGPVQELRARAAERAQHAISGFSACLSSLSTGQVGPAFAGTACGAAAQALPRALHGSAGMLKECLSEQGVLMLAGV